MNNVYDLRGVILVLISVFLVACSSVEEQSRKGAEVKVFPVVHTLSLKASESKSDYSKQQIREFLDDYRTLIVTQSVTLTWSNEAGKALAEFAKAKILALGAAPHYIKLEKMSDSNTRHFDFDMQVVQYLVDEVTCEKSAVQSFYSEDDGCFSENARWKSMVAPERMIPSLKQTRE